MINLKQACQNPHDIAINRWLRQIKSDTGNSSRSVRANPFQARYSFIGIWKLPPKVSHNLLSCSLHIAHSRIITQTFPSLKQTLFRGIGQTFNSWKPVQESFVVWNNCIHSGLLKHDFRYPDVIRIFTSPPRQISLVFIIPVEEFFTKRNNILLRPHDDTVFFQI